MIKIAICDDNNEICSFIETILIEYFQNKLELFSIDVFYSGQDLISHINTVANFDIIFLDIELNDTNGIAIGKKIREDFEDDITKIIYISGNKEYAIDLFEISPINFLIKPFTKEKVLYNLKKCIYKINKDNKLFYYKQHKIIQREYFKNIIYFESAGRKIKLVTENKEEYFYDRIQNIYQKLKNEQFINTHNCYIVNYNYIRKVTLNNIILYNEKIIPLSRSKKDEALGKILKIKEGLLE